MANYLYNGVELPDINTVWDKEKYPYALICDFTELNIGYVAMFSNVLFIGTDDSAGTPACSYVSYKCVDGAWAYDSGKDDAQNVIATRPFWTSHDILKNDGSVYLAASTPVPVGSASGDGFALYNGVKLPKLPEWDKTAYPYAYMQVLDASELDPSVNGTIVGLIVRNKKAVFGSVLDDCLTTTGPYNEITFIWTDSQGVCDLYADIGIVLSLAEWNSFGESTYESDSNDSHPLVWSNYDILNADGSIYLAASDPISLDGMNVIAWDGDTTGLDMIDADGIPLAKISNDSLSAKSLLGGYISANGTGEQGEAIAYPIVAYFDETTDEAMFLPGYDATSVYTTGNVAVVVHEAGLNVVAAFDGKGGTLPIAIILQKDAVLPEDMPSNLTPGIWSISAAVEDHDVYTRLIAYPANSSGGEEPPAEGGSEVEATVFCNSITDTSATAWLTIKGLDSNTEYTAEFAVYRNDATGVLEEVLTFTGSDNIQYHEFTGLLPETDYVLAVNVYPTGGESVYSGECEFTTLEADEETTLDFSNTALTLFDPIISATEASFAVSWSGIPTTTKASDTVQYFITAEIDIGTEVLTRTVYLFSSDIAEDGEHELSFDNLRPFTSYTIDAKLVYNTTGEFSDFTDTGVSTYNVFSTPEDVAAAVITETSGDGKALYNGVVLPVLPITASATARLTIVRDLAWPKYDRTYPGYVLMYGYHDVSTFKRQTDGSFAASGSEWYYRYTLNENGEWSGSEFAPSTSFAFTAADVIWANYNVQNADSSTYLSASDPIPLDGYNVIEWNGGIKDLTVIDNYYYKVSDTILNAEQVGQTILVNTLAEDLEKQVGYINADAVVDDASISCVRVNTVPYSVYGTNHYPETGTYMMKNLLYTNTLLAYPASVEPELNITMTASFDEITDSGFKMELGLDGLDGDSYYTIKTHAVDVATGEQADGATINFAGGNTNIDVRFSGLSPETGYTITVDLHPQGSNEVIASAEFSCSTVANAELDFSEAYMEMVEVTPSSTSVFFRVGCYKFPSDNDGSMITFPVTGTTSDGKTVDMAIKSAASGASFVRGTLSGLTPGTEYTVTFEAFHEGVSTGVIVTTTFRTTTYDRQAFLEGLAFGLMTGGEFNG